MSLGHDPSAGGEDLRERPMGDLLKQLGEQTSRLVHQEMELAKAELSAKGKETGAGAGLLTGAGVAGLLALGTLTAFLVLVLDSAMDAKLAALIVALVWAVVAGGLAMAGRNRLRRAAPPVPEQTVETLKEDVQWAKTPTRSAATSSRHAPR
jgi:hypothetical protein